MLVALPVLRFVELEVSAVSIHAYAHLADQYALMPCGASMGDGYGPIVVAKTAFDPADLTEKMQSGVCDV